MTDQGTVYEVNKGIDPALLAALNANGGGMFGNNNQLWPLLFLFGRGMGTWGGEGCGTACGTLARESITTPKDVASQLTAFQHWASDNAGHLQQAICGIDKSICCSTRDIMSAVNALTPQMYQSFATLTQGMDHGFSSAQLANCQSTAAIQHALCEGFAAASRQGCSETAAMSQVMNSGFAQVALEGCKNTALIDRDIESGIHKLEALNQSQYNLLAQQADRIALQESIQAQAQNNALNLQLLSNANAAAMAACDLKNQLAACCCDIKGTIKDDGQLTRSLINDQEVMRLRAQLADTKDALGNSNQSILIGEQINRAVGTIVHHLPQCPPPCCPPYPYYGGSGGVAVDVDVAQRQRQRQANG